MTFRFIVDAATHLPVIGADILDGRLESGEIRHGTRAIARTATGAVPIVIRSVAFVERAVIDRRQVTLQIEPPGVPLAALVGATVEPADG